MLKAATAEMRCWPQTKGALRSLASEGPISAQICLACDLISLSANNGTMTVGTEQFWHFRVITPSELCAKARGPLTRAVLLAKSEVISELGRLLERKRSLLY